MVPAFVVVILAVLLGIAIIAIIISRVDSHYDFRDYKKEKAEWAQSRNLIVGESESLRKTLRGLALLLPKQYEILGGAFYYPYGSGWDGELIAELVERKDNKSTNKTNDKIIKKLEASGK